MRRLRFYLRKCRLLAVFLALWLAVLAGAVQQDKSAHPAEITLAAPRDLAPGEKDPYYISSIGMVWEPLVGVDADGHLRGVLAASWQANEDATVWRFKLRRGISFQDGEPFDADAVVANFRRWENMGYRLSSFYGFLLARVYPGYAGIEKIADDEVELRFSEPQPMLVYRMINFSSPMFSPKCFDIESGDFTGYAVGTGPFAIVDRKPGQYVVLKRFDGYHGTPAKSEYIRLVSMPNAATRFSALRAGEVEGVLDLGSLTPSLTLALLRDPRFAASANRNTINQYVTVNQSRFPFSDVRMMRAISLLIDREAIVRYYFNGQSEPTMNLLNRCNPFYKEIPLVHDEAEAVRLADEVMGGETYRATFLIPQYGLSRYSYKEVVEYLQAALRKLHIEARILILDSATHSKYMSAGNYDFSIGTHGLANYAPETLMESYMATWGSNNKLYHVGYENPAADAVFKELPEVIDMDRRRAYYDELQDMAVEAPPLIPFGSDNNVVVYNAAKLTGYNATTYGITLDQVERR